MTANNIISTASNEIAATHKTRKAIELYKQAQELLENSLQWHNDNSFGSTSELEADFDKILITLEGFISESVISNLTTIKHAYKVL